MRGTKDLHPLRSEFSERDYDTGWAFEVIRLYTWKFRTGDGWKHALPKVDTAYPHIQPAMCGTMPEHWRDTSTREARIIFFGLERCPECLYRIGAPEWKPVTPRKKPGKRPINSDFNKPTGREVLEKHPNFPGYEPWIRQDHG